MLHLQTNSIITRQNCTPTLCMIKQLHRLAELDNMPQDLKIKNRANILFFDCAKIAGVDYDDE